MELQRENARDRPMNVIPVNIKMGASVFKVEPSTLNLALQASSLSPRP